MATVIDVSGRLGEYMLKGWILTDRICTECSKVPLMRSPPSAPTETYFCVNCDPAPSSGSTANVSTSRPWRTSAAHQATAFQDYQSTSSISNSSGMSRSSTPPTEVSNVPSSPTFAPIMDTAELLRRRQQSDTASAEIGRRMLTGWAMLADECPSPGCHGIPLVRPPKVGANVDPRKECVICRIVYIVEKDAYGQDRLVPMQPSLSPAVTSRAPNPALVAPSPPSPVSADKGKARAYPEVHLQPQVAASPQQSSKSAPVHLGSATSSALEDTAQSLECTLVVLSERLQTYASGSIIDPGPIGQTADAISKVSQALLQVKQLLWSERQALLS
ncbi:hypothetical protein DICSQDRAFT_103439 [Dichomitus squalens LYAD-421 SS1]|uniref:uncharacterized protein n=1 Tax=Dichomitus squalens (strain LYAD-421) TaxID=732165 RepID=UPI0004415C70|nr:uncharacterized protein DICSQDRAFT_103439 [Dichomitus squalens LYAD-421 SS1]EJF62998.1 hypothetical protein DICSQDRAFT_103439 [Dichomitus squalens LYAD-421 SS1]